MKRILKGIFSVLRQILMYIFMLIALVLVILLIENPSDNPITDWIYEFRLKRYAARFELTPYFKEPAPLMRQNTAARAPFLCVNLETRSLDPAFLKLPRSLRATSPEGVKSVVWVDCRDKVVGKYSDGALAVQAQCDLTAIDRSEWRVVNSHHLDGPMPDSTKRRPGSMSGGRPYNDIARFLESIAQK